MDKCRGQKKGRWSGNHDEICLSDFSAEKEGSSVEKEFSRNLCEYTRGDTNATKREMSSFYDLGGIIVRST